VHPKKKKCKLNNLKEYIYEVKHLSNKYKKWNKSEYKSSGERNYKKIFYRFFYKKNNFFNLIFLFSKF